jgi:hypothetical protein
MKIKNIPKRTIAIVVVVISSIALAIPILRSDFSSVWWVWLSLVFWVIGFALGWFAFYLDRIVDIYFGNPNTELAVYAKRYFKASEYRKGIRLLMHNRNLQMRLTFRSAVFQVVWVFLALFTVTSTQVLFGKGFVLALGLHLLLDEWQSYVLDKLYLKKWLFWQVNRQISDKELKLYMWVMTAVVAFVFLTVLF